MPVFRSAFGKPFDGPRDAWQFRVAAKPDDADTLLEHLFLRHAMQGDKEAFIALASMHAAAVYATARNLCSSDLEAIELTENALQSARDRIRAMPAGLSFRVFVCRFMVNEAIERLRRATPPPFTLLHRFLPATAGGDRSTPSPQGFPDVELLAQRPDIARRITDALALLEPEDRAAFVLRVVGEVPMDDAAAILDLPVWIVRLRTHRACLLVNAYLSYLAARAGIV